MNPVATLDRYLISKVEDLDQLDEELHYPLDERDN